MTDSTERKKLYCFSLFIIIVFACLRLCYFYSLRTSYHIDEIWSYGFANSYYDPFIFKSSLGIRDIKAEDIKNIREWIDGDVFKRYIVADRDELFTFDSVIYNKRYDDSPSLFEVLLHFVCSFFPDSFSLNYAFFVNFILYFVTCVLVFLLAYECTSDRFAAFFSLIYFVFSGCGTANYLYLRIYSLYSTLVIALALVIAKIISCRKSNAGIKRPVILYSLLFFVSLAGYFTHFFFLLIAFLLSATVCLYFLFAKKIRKMLIFGMIMLSSVLAYYVVYPYGLNHVIGLVDGSDYFENGYAYPYHWQLSYLNKIFFSDTIGFYLDINIPNIIMISGWFLIIAFVLFLIYFLFRKEVWMKKVIRLFRRVWECRKIALRHLEDINPCLYIMLIVSVLCIFLIPIKCRVINMGFPDRYGFAPMLLFLVFYASITGKIFSLVIKSVKSKKAAILFSAVFFVVFFSLPVSNTGTYTKRYIFDYWDSGKISEYTAGKNTYVVTENYRDLTWFSGCLYNTESVYINLTVDLSKDDFILPDLKPGYIVMISVDGIIYLGEPEDEKTYKDVELSDMTDSFLSVSELIERIEEDYSVSLNYIDTCSTYMGDYVLYAIE